MTTPGGAKDVKKTTTKGDKTITAPSSSTPKLQEILNLDPALPFPSPVTRRTHVRNARATNGMPPGGSLCSELCIW
ncbi:MAG: hypothetical protein KME30_16755 [Iphinoe sp. HA4291-MV1]|nr:hypothetical protein [Iphinoe sp. HA4291-MV1]